MVQVHPHAPIKNSGLLRIFCFSKEDNAIIKKTLPMTDKYLIALTHFPKFGPASLHKLAALNSWQAAYDAPAALFLQLGLDAKIADEFVTWRAAVNADSFLETMDKNKIKAVTLDDELYPPLLKNIYQPPPLLFYQGELRPELYELPLAVVGSRRPSPYGQMVVNRLVKELAQNNLTIVSGLAFGIDAMAHQAALAAAGKTIAVLGSGLDRPNLYPAANRFLADKIITAGGALFSEFPPLTSATKFSFPRRNRLISGLSLGVLVVEAAAKSGSLITAHYGLEQNREVMAVPGNIFSPQSAGTNHLIKLGAKPITKVEDIWEIFNLEIGPAKLAANQNLNEAEINILQLINEEAKHLDEIKNLLTLDIGVITSTLTLMEIKGLVKNLGNSTYIKL
jgi:DNA processing protein